MRVKNKIKILKKFQKNLKYQKQIISNYKKKMII